jgi:hydrogenase (niFe) small subunit hydA
VGVAGAGAAIAAHAVGSAIHYRKQHMKEEANVSLPAFGDAPGSPDKDTEE